MNRVERTGDGPLGITRFLLKKPVIAAINGAAVAGGFELALFCDLRISYKECEMGVYCRRFGVPLIDGGTFRLSLLIGLSRAMDLILTGRKITGEEAEKIGLVNRLVEKEKVLEDAIKLAEMLCELPQNCMRNDRLSLLNSAYNFNLNRHIESEYEFGIKSLLSKEAFQGANLFTKGFGKHGKELKPKL